MVTLNEPSIFIPLDAAMEILDLAEKRTLGDAFVTVMHERAVRRELLAAYDVDALDEARRIARDAFVSDHVTGGLAQLHRRGEALKPLLGAGLTLRQTARYLEVPLVEVVAAGVNPRDAQEEKAEAIADIEEAIIDCDPRTTTLESLCAKYSVSRKLATILAKRHGVSFDTRVWPDDVRQEARELATRDFTLGPSAIRALLLQRHPELDPDTFTKQSVVSLIRSVRYKKVAS